MKRHEETLARLNWTIDLNPNHTWSIAHRGETYCLMQRYAQALADFDRAIELDPSYVWAIAHRGETYRLMQNYTRALADFDRAIDLKPNYVLALAHRGAVYRYMKRNERALANLNQAIDLKPDYAWALIHRAETYVVLRRYEQALDDVNRAIAIDQNIISHWRGERGLLLNYMGRYAETIESCQRALQKDANDHVAIYSLTVAQALSKGLPQADIDAAQAVLQPVLDTKARAGALYRLAGLAALQNQTPQALHYLQQAISLDDEPAEIACHDPAWLGLHADPHFQALIAATTATQSKLPT